METSVQQKISSSKNASEASYIEHVESQCSIKTYDNLFTAYMLYTPENKRCPKCSKPYSEED